MKNTKLIKLLKTFSPSEIKRFRDFVKSPYFNKNKNVIRLNEALFSFYPLYENRNLDERLMFLKVFGKEKYDYFRIKNVISDLYNLGIEYLRLHPNIYTAFDRDYNLLVELRTRKLWSYHKKEVAALEKEFSAEGIKDGIYLYNKYLLTMEGHLAKVLEKPDSVTMIQEEFNTFYEFSILNFLKFYNLMMHISKESRVKTDKKMLNEVLSYIKTNDVSENPTIVTYKYLVLLAAERDETFYFTLKEHYLANFSKLSYEDAYYANMYLVGFATDKYNIEGDRRFISECSELLEHSYRNQRVTLGELLYPNFINYVKVFARAGKITLAREFMRDYRERLPANIAESCINFSEAFVLHQQGYYAEALALISRVSFPWVIMKIQVKLMQIQLNYRLGYFEESRNMIESFRKMLNKEENISDEYRSSILGFLKCAVLLLNIREETVRKKRKNLLEILRKEILPGQRNHFGMKFWVEEMLKEPGF
ncbi:MAG: hypothetical protein JNK43_05295 [Ignavibacteria bacterium]|nr:hypothetical protein [Ignavibacteria bacterium]